MTELKNLSSTCEFGELHDSLLTYKTVDGIRSEKTKDKVLRKGAEMTIEKAINKCCSDEITKMHIKEVSKDKEVNGISEKNLLKKSLKKKQGETDQVVKRDQEKWIK